MLPHPVLPLTLFLSSLLPLCKREILSREVQYSGYVLQAAVEHYES